jgi:glutaredoxin
MRAARILLATGAVLLASALDASAQQTVYRWVDKDGKVQFSDSPPPEAANATAKTMGGGYVEEGQVPYATQIASQRFPVVLYAAADCGELCTQGRDFLGKRGVPFSEKDVKDKAVADEVKAMIGQLQVPVLKVGTSSYKGFNDELWTSALDQAGYARTRIPGQPGYKPQ